MDLQLLPYALPQIISSSIALLLSILAFSRWNVRVAKSFAILMLITTGWSFSFFFVITTQNIESKLAWFNLVNSFAAIAPTVWLVMLLEYTGGTRWIFSKRSLWLAIEPLVHIAMIWTNDSHHLLSSGFSLAASGPVLYFDISRGPFFFFQLLYNYGLFVICYYFLLRFYQRQFFQRQALVFLTCLTLPLISNILDIFKVNPLTPFGATSFFFSITGVILGIGIYYFHLFDVTPIARDTVLDGLATAIVVCDIKGRILDLNATASRLFAAISGKECNKFIGEPLINILCNNPVLWEAIMSCRTEKKQVALVINEELRYYEISNSLLMDRFGHCIGRASNLNDTTEFERIHLQLLEQLDEIQALQHQLQEQVIRDLLTGCFNRRYLEETLEREISRSLREGYAISVVMIDIDHFKQINDSFGHHTGDKVLRAIGSFLRENTRSSDIVCRYGGDEFLLVLPNVYQETAFKRAEFWREGCATLQVDYKGKKVHFTISCGIATIPQHGVTEEQILEVVDQALYIAKGSGRNRVISSQQWLLTE